MRDSIRIRPAEPGDAEVAAVLLYSAYTHTHVTYPPREAPEGWVERLREYFRQEGNRFSYQYSQVAVRGSDVVGLALSFGGRDEARLNATVGPWLERSAADDEWYVDALAVLENWSRQGIGTSLLRTAEDQAREHHYATVALDVAVGNTEATDLYTHLGYVVTHEGMVYGRPHLHMVKNLDDGGR
jgi:ribosomal protein S18 acetylase RimI-like enzyme